MDRATLYESWRVDLQVGGTCARCAPMCTGVFDGRGLSLPDLQFAVEALHAIRVAGEHPLSPDLQLAGGPELFDHPEPVAVWTFLRSAEDISKMDLEYGWYPAKEKLRSNDAHYRALMGEGCAPSLRRTGH